MTQEELKELEDRLWQAADKLRVDSGLKASEYATPILGLIFLRFASIRYNRIKPKIDAIIADQTNKRKQQSEIVKDYYKKLKRELWATTEAPHVIVSGRLNRFYCTHGQP